MSKTNGSEHAFPHMHLDSSGTVKLEGGLSKREYFAAMAMQGFCSDSEFRKEKFELGWNSKDVAELAVSYADALIEQFNKEK